MAITTAELRAKLGDLPPRVRQWAKLHRFWFESAGVTLIALLVLAAIGIIALRRASGWDEQARRLRAIDEQMSALASGFQPADSVEASEWRASETALARLAAESMDPLATASLIAARAEEVGIYSTRVSLVSNDTIEIPGNVVSGAWTAESQATTILVEFVDDLGATARFVGVLPPSVEVASVSLAPEDGLLRSRLRLIARSIAGPS